MGGWRSLPEGRVSLAIAGLGGMPVIHRMGAGLTAPGQGSGSGKAPRTPGRTGSLAAEAYHVLVAGVRLGAGVAVAARIPVAILHCGVHTGSPRPPSPDAPQPPTPRPARAPLTHAAAVPRARGNGCSVRRTPRSPSATQSRRAVPAWRLRGPVRTRAGPLLCALPRHAH